MINFNLIKSIIKHYVNFLKLLKLIQEKYGFLHHIAN
ncbi:hypothetical protein ES708_13438 [subsurface metagenome]